MHLPDGYCNLNRKKNTIHHKKTQQNLELITTIHSITNTNLVLQYLSWPKIQDNQKSTRTNRKASTVMVVSGVRLRYTSIP